MSKFKNSTLLLLTLASTIVAISCGRSAQSYVELGNDFYQKGKYADATINYKKALQKDPGYGEAYFRLGRAAAKEGNAQDAYQDLTRAEQLLPNREDVKVELADFALAVYLYDPQHPQKLYDDVTRVSRELLQKNPRSFDGLRLAGAVASSDRKYAEAADYLERANAVQAMDPNVVGPWVEALFQTNQADRAEKLALALIDKHKDFGPIYDVLYTRYMASKRVADAQKLLNTKVNNNPGDKNAVLQLAQYYLGQQKTTEWTATLNKLLDNPKAFPDARAEVGDFYAALKNWDEASKQYNEGMRTHPEKKSLYQKKIVNLLLAQQKRPEALQMLEQISLADPKDYGSRAIRAALLLDSGNPAKLDTAISELEVLSTLLPHDEAISYNLGRAYMAKGNLNAARTQFQEALKRNNRYIPPRVFLAAVAQRRGDYNETMRYANEILALDQKDPSGRLWHAVGLMGLRSYDQADTEFARLTQEFPDSEDVQLQLAMLRMAEKKYKEADVIFTRLYRSGSGDVRPLAGIALASAAQGQFESAISSLQHEIQQSPGSVPLHSMLASLAALGGKSDLAVEENQWLVKNDPKDVNAYLRLAGAYRKKGDNGAAVAAAQKASELAPKDPKVLESAAYLKSQSGHSADAVGDYRRLLAIDPNEPTNLNNLAYLLAEEGRDLDEALTLAGRATQKAPENLGFRDTLAWVYVKKNMNDSAIQVLQILVQKSPGEASFHYHLGIALMQKGDKQGAKAQLGVALTQKPDSDMADKIKEAIAKIG
ncbi:MAG TPA: tetratricopeptide repeat protein [Bryobacteraceae bacterium]|jgi:tetratricopeptide (TPR) repeat protein|nr:tetratricopeptide repeat protein [Bryobacteraceae bacterium]